MPRIPASAVSVGLPSVSAQPSREVLEIADAAVSLTEASAQLTTRLAEAERADELIAKSGAMEASLADLQLSIQEDPTINTVARAGEVFRSGAEQIYNEHGQSESDVVGRALQKQFLQSSLRAGVSVRQLAFKRQADTSLAALDVTRERLERTYLTAPDDEKRDQNRALYAQSVNLNGYLTEQQKGDLIRDYATDTDIARVRSLIQSGQFESAGALLTSNTLIGVDPVQTLSLQRELSIAESRAQTDLARDLRKIEDEKSHTMLRRFFDPDDPNGVPTVGEVLDAEFSSRATTEHFIKMASDHARGVDLNVVNSNVYNELYNGVYNGTITNFSQILPWVGDGIDPTTAEKLRLDIEGLQKPERKAEIESFKILLDFGKTSILGNALVRGRDPKGAELFKEFNVEARRRFDQGLKDGKNHLDMVTSGNKDYIGDFINRPPYLRTGIEVGKDKMEAMQAAMERRQAPDGTPTPTPVPRITLEEDTDAGFAAFVDGLGVSP